jgi:Arc/MetJ-type ribon-helix-helix transcriptional regulator
MSEKRKYPIKISVWINEQQMSKIERLRKFYGFASISELLRYLIIKESTIVEDD